MPCLAGTITVTGDDGGPVDGIDPSLVNIHCSNLDATLEPGDDILVEFSIMNDNDESVGVNMEILAGGEVLNTVGVAVRGNSSRDVTQRITFNDPGTYNVDARAVSIE